MGNTFTTLTHTILAQKALEGFTAGITPLRAFGTNFSDEAVNPGDKVKVLYIGAQSAAKAWAGSYVFGDSTASGLDITIDQDPYVAWGITDKDLTNQPQLTLEKLAFQNGFTLAKSVLQTIWSQVTNANYGAAAFTGAASTMDADDIADLEATCDEADWPVNGRSLILAPTYHAALVKDNAVQGTLGVKGNGVLEKSVIPGLHNFDLYKSNLIPANGENLKGFAVHADAILVAMRRWNTDVAKITAMGGMYEVLTNEAGMTIELLDYYDIGTRTSKRVLQAHFGYRVGNSAGLKRIVSA